MWRMGGMVCGLLILGSLFLPCSTSRAEDEDLVPLMKLFVDTFDQVDRNYVKNVDRRKLIEAALNGMMEELDPYSNFITSDELQRFNTQVDQEFGGVGIQVGYSPDKRLMVLTPLPGSPAFRAGIRAGDLILKVEAEGTENWTLEDAVRRLKGKPGESVKLGILHPGANQLEEIQVTREMVHVSTVLGDKYNPDGSWDFMLDPEKKIGYVRISAFSRDTTKELKAALDKLVSQGMKGLILDLRFNPGGLLQAAIEISDLFVEEGRIVSTKGRNTEERTWNAAKEGTYAGFPMAVLVNGYSASASEIVSACLSDHSRAVLVGERTWGKGSVQNVIELEGGKSALKLTTASYHRPSGKNIHRFPGAKDTDEWGVMPNDGYRIPQTLEEMRKYQEYRTARDVLKDDGPPKSDYVDPQLQKSLEYLNAQLAKPAAAIKLPAAANKQVATIQPGLNAKTTALFYEGLAVYRSLKLLKCVKL